MLHKNLASQDSHSPSQEQVENNSGVDFPAFRCVTYNSIGTTYADASIASPTDDIRGITQAIIQDGSRGYILVYGTLYNIDTSAWTEGTSLYCGASGVLTDISGGGPQVANVLKQHASLGVIQVTCLDTPTATPTPFVQDTDSINIDLVGPFIKADLRISTDAAAAGNIKATTTIHGTPNHGLHIQYPTAAPSTNLDADSVNADGVATSISRSDHSHAIDTGTPVSQTPDQANAEGVSPSLARADHVHNIPADVPATQAPDQANAEGVSTSFARADHIHNIPAAAPSTNLSPVTTNTEGVGASFARADHTHTVETGLVGDIVTIQPDASASAGVVNRFARADHRHAIDAATPSSQAPDQANAEGVSTSFARADHIHNIPADAPTTTLSPATSNAEGVGSSFARNDHTHAVATALVGDITTIQPDAAASAGTANTFARGDHRHAIDAAAPSTLNPDQSNTEGSSNSFARADHIHNVPAAAPSATFAPSTANAKGVSTSFALADHTHAHAIAVDADVSTILPDDAAAAGAVDKFAKASHKHAIATAVAATQTPDQTNAKGVSTSFARADHTHNIPTGSASTISTNANAQGAAAAFARQDHLHQITQGTASLDHIPQYDGSNWIATYPEQILNPARSWQKREEFIANGASGGLLGNNAVYGDLNWDVGAAGGASGAQFNGTLATANHPGVSRFTVGGAGGNYVNLNLPSSILLGGGAIFLETLVYIETLATVGNDYSFRIGFGDSTNAADNSNGAYFEYTRGTSANWLVKTANGGTRTTTTTTTAVVAGSWIKLAVSVNAAASSITYYINGSSVGTITTNIPTTNIVGLLIQHARVAGTPPATNVDYFWVYQRFTTAR